MKWEPKGQAVAGLLQSEAKSPQEQSILLITVSKYRAPAPAALLGRYQLRLGDAVRGTGHCFLENSFS